MHQILKRVREHGSENEDAYGSYRHIGGLLGREDVQDTVVINAKEHRESRDVVNETVVEVLTAQANVARWCRMIWGASIALNFTS